MFQVPVLVLLQISDSGLATRILTTRVSLYRVIITVQTHYTNKFSSTESVPSTAVLYILYRVQKNNVRKKI